jgi:large subunit ribosomal protein L29
VRAREIRERNDEELTKLEARLAQELFQLRFQNFTNRLNATSSVRQTRRDLARVQTVRRERALRRPVPVARKAAPKPKEKTDE